jgi:hypothetical protein
MSACPSAARGGVHTLFAAEPGDEDCAAPFSEGNEIAIVIATAAPAVAKRVCCTELLLYPNARGVL